MTVVSRTHTGLGTCSPDARVRGMLGGCVRAPNAAETDCNMQLLAQRSAPASPPLGFSPHGVFIGRLSIFCAARIYTR